MKVIRYVTPYKNGKPRFPERGRPGVYLIKENGVLVYVGFSGTDLYKTMYRHFQEWNHNGQKVITYNLATGQDYKVRVIYCTEKQAIDLESALIGKYEPRDNTMIPNFWNYKKRGAIYRKYKETPVDDCPF